MSSYLKNEGHEIYLFGPEEGDLFKRAKINGVNVVPITWSKINYFNPIFLISLFFKLKRLNLDAIIFNSFIDVRDASIVALLSGIQKRILRIGMPILPKNKLAYRWSFKYGISNFVANSLNIQEMFNQSIFLDEECCDFIPNGIDLNKFNFVDNPICNNGFVFGNCVRLTDQKGLFDFIDIAKTVMEYFPQAKFLLAGTGELEGELNIYAKEVGIDQDRFKFLGHVESVVDFYSSIDHLIFTSRFEGTASTLIEAMSMGCTIFCYDTSSMTEMIDHGVDGFKVKPFNKHEFSNQIINVVKLEQDELNAIRKNALAKVRAFYNKELNFSKWKDYILFD